jgi:hypothetical protein
MKKAAIAVMALAMITASVNAQQYHYVRPYYNYNNTLVPGHYQTNPNGLFYDNWSTYPNVNPFTGQQGTIHTMPRTYVPRPHYIYHW